MSKESVVRAISELEKAFYNGNHKADVNVEVLEDAKEVSFYLDDEQEEPVGIITIYLPEQAQ